MNKINPFILFIVLVGLLIVSIYKKNQIKLEVKDEQKIIFLFEQEAQKISKLRSNWDNINLETRIKNIFSLKELSLKSVINSKNNLYEINVISLSEEEANELVKKVLNSAFEIKKIELIKISQNNISFSVEILKWEN